MDRLVLLVWIVVVGVALWFGFELGRKWQLGVQEEELERHEETRARGGIRLNTITVRR